MTARALRPAALIAMAATAAVALVLSSPAYGDTLIVTGYVVPPSNQYVPGTSNYGFDFGGYFGPPGANLSNDPFTVTWQGTAGQNVTDAQLTINGITIDMVVGPIGQSEWDNNYCIQTNCSPFLQVESQYVLNTGPNYPLDSFVDPNIGGAALLRNGINASLETDMFLHVDGMTLSVPSPPLGSGLPGLLLLVVAWWIRQKNKVGGAAF